MRAIRELLIVALRVRGALLIHGAAVAIGERVVILAGPRQTGKTTLLLHLLQALQGRLVSNDRVFVWPQMNEFVTLGVPTIVSLRPGTLEMLPAVADRLARSGFAWPLARAEVHPDAAPGRTAISPAQLCDLVEVEPSPGGPVAAIVFPTPAPHDLLHLERLTGEAAVDAVTTATVRRGGAVEDRGTVARPFLRTPAARHRHAGPVRRSGCACPGVRVQDRPGCARQSTGAHGSRRLADRLSHPARLTVPPFQ